MQAMRSGLCSYQQQAKADAGNAQRIVLHSCRLWLQPLSAVETVQKRAIK